MPVEATRRCRPSELVRYAAWTSRLRWRRQSGTEQPPSGGVQLTYSPTVETNCSRNAHFSGRGLKGNLTPLALVLGPDLKNLRVNPNGAASIFSDCDQQLSASHHGSFSQHLDAKIGTIDLLVVDMRPARAEIAFVAIHLPFCVDMCESWVQQLFEPVEIAPFHGIASLLFALQNLGFDLG